MTHSNGIENHGRLWTMLLAGLAIGMLGIHLTVVRPIRVQSANMQSQFSTMQQQLEQLVDMSDRVEETNSLLGRLQSQHQQLDKARTALKACEQLRADIEAQAEKANDALVSLDRIASIQSKLIDQRQTHGAALESIDQMISLRERLIEEQESFPEAFDAINAIGKLQESVVAEGADAEQAASALQNLTNLKSQLMNEGDDVVEARDNAQRMIALQDVLTSGELKTETARANLDSLLQMHSDLTDSTDDIVDAVQVLELLADFRSEFDQQMTAMVGMRRQLMEVVLMESTVVRAVRILEPLIQLGKLRRLSDEEVRDAARVILDQRTSRLYEQKRSVKRLPLDEELFLPPGTSPFDDNAEQPLLESLVPLPREVD